MNKPIRVNDEGYIIINDSKTFDAWCRDCDWDGIKDFEKDTGVTFEEIKGIPFLVVHNRVYTL